MRAEAPGAGRVALHVELDAPLPEALAVGGGTALLVAGWCVVAGRRIVGLELLIDGAPQPVTAFGVPRLDVFAALHPTLDPFATAGLAEDPASPDDPGLHGYRSGFWGTATIRAQGAVLGLRATLADGGCEEAELARFAVPEPVAPVRVAAPPAGRPLVAIAMATYDPPADLLRRQLDSIRAQSHADWVCVISDDASRPERWADLRRLTEDDPRFVLSRSEERLGFYRNFERALALVPPEATHVALADQDDRWEPDKLATLLDALGDARLVYSDCRVVARDGGPLADSYWTARDNEHRDLLSVLVANSITGAASLFGRELLDDALPFPPAQFALFHDHWLGLVALSLGEVAYVDRPLYDYVQHRDASLGHAAATAMPTLRSRVAKLRGDPRERIRLWRLHYFVDVCRLVSLCTVLLVRCGDRMPAGKRRVLERFLATDRRALSAVGLFGRGLRELTGRPTTLGAEWMLVYAFAWRRLLAATTRDRPVRGLRLDAVPPASFVQAPQRSAPPVPAVAALADKVAPLALAVADVEPRINLLIPTIDLEHLFGGYIAKLNLAARLADRGARVRIVTTDPVGPLPRAWRQTVESYSGLAGLFDRVEVAFGREAQGLRVSPRDRFVASTWWTAHIADAALEGLEAERFLYLVQEHEPFTFPMSSHAALAAASYDLDHRALFSTELLRAWFRRHGVGVYRAGAARGDAASASFQNAITRVPAPTVEALRDRRPRRLLFYARPEPHAARNLFELGMLGLRRALEDGAFRDGWELRGIGTTAPGRRLAVGGGADLELLPRTDQAAYARTLAEHDVGLALMYTPHPSLVPIEMASAGLLTVTNGFEDKTAAALAAISPNLLCAQPTVAAIAERLREAAGAVEDVERRVAGSAVAWSRDWAASFDDATLDRIDALLGS